MLKVRYEFKGTASGLRDALIKEVEQRIGLIPYHKNKFDQQHDDGQRFALEGLHNMLSNLVIQGEPDVAQ